MNHIQAAEKIIASEEITVYEVRALKTALEELYSACLEDPASGHVLLRAASLSRKLEAAAMRLDVEAIRQISAEVVDTEWEKLRLS